jgi:hypothetical protein
LIDPCFNIFTYVAHALVSVLLVLDLWKTGVRVHWTLWGSFCPWPCKGCHRYLVVRTPAVMVRKCLYSQSTSHRMSD